MDVDIHDREILEKIGTTTFEKTTDQSAEVPDYGEIAHVILVIPCKLDSAILHK
jgi:hypothetical protein